MRNNEFIKGVKFWFSGLTYLFKNKDLWKYLILPVLINFILVSLIFFYGSHFFSSKIPEFSFEIISNNVIWWKLFFLYVKKIVLYLVFLITKILAFIVAAVMYVVVFVLLTTIVGSPFYDKLSEKIEIKNGHKDFNQTLSLYTLIFYPVMNALKMTLFEVIVVIIFFPVNWVPILGNVLYAVIISFPLLMSLIAYSTERRLWGFYKLLAFVWKNKVCFLGFGIFAFMSMVPFGISIISFPVSVVGATLLFLEKLPKD